MRYPTVPTRPLVGRDGELAELAGLLDAVGAGESAVVVVSGEPGIGKTVLLGAAVTQAHERRYLALGGRASELERDTPFAVFLDALERAVCSTALLPREALGDEDLAALAAVFPALAALAPGAPRHHQPDARQRLLRALHRLIEVLAGERPLLLALDDLHVADPSSIDLVCRLLHRGLARPSLLLLASRPGQSETRLQIAFEEAERYRQARHIELGPLSVAQAGALLGHELDPALAARLYRESGGNPFYLEQLAAAARRREQLALTASTAPRSSVPAGVAAAIRAELDGISSTAKGLLAAAAVVGDPFDAELAAAVTGNAPQDAIGSLDELLERDLIRATDSPRRFRFRHPIVHDAVYASAGVAWRLDAHARAASLLDAQGAPAAARAPHVERAARTGDAGAAAVLAKAGHELLLRAPASAAHWFESALRLAPRDDDGSPSHLDLMAQHAIALGRAGHIRESRDELRRVLRLGFAEPGGLRVRVAVLSAVFDGLLGNQAEARVLLREELDRLPDQRGEDAAELKRALADTCFRDADWEGTTDWARAALDADRRGVTRVAALALLAIGELGRGNAPEAQASVAQATQLFDNVMNDEEAAYFGPSTAIYLAAAEIEAERFADAIRHAERGLGIARATGQYELIALHLLVMQARALGMIGRVAELASVAETATEASLLSQGEQSLSLAMSLRAWASLLTGELPTAVRLAGRARALVGASNPEVAHAARITLAAALLEMGEPDRARELFVQPGGQLALPSLPGFKLEVYELLVAAELARGDPARAGDLARAAWQAAKRLGLDLAATKARRALALVALARGEAHAALDHALASWQGAERVDARIEASRSQVLLGRALAATGDRRGAIAALKEAHTALLDCGAYHYGDQAARELRRLGRAVPTRGGRCDGKPPVLGLTDREREVMELVAAGRTNRQIAGDLVLSVRTIDRHLERIYDKLNVHSRAAATSAFEQARNHVAR